MTSIFIYFPSYIKRISVSVYFFQESRSEGPIPSVLPWLATYHAIHGQQLVPTLQAAVAVSHTPGDDSRDVDGRVLLLAPHDVEAQAFVCFGQLHAPGMCVALTCCEGCYSGLGRESQGDGARG